MINLKNGLLAAERAYCNGGSPTDRKFHRRV